MLSIGTESLNFMAKDIHWQDLYQAALLETDPRALRARISFAEEEIRKRNQELMHASDGASLQEQRRIADALNSLCVLEKYELKPGAAEGRRNGA
jgi:hypothetical protein